MLIIFGLSRRHIFLLKDTPKARYSRQASTHTATEAEITVKLRICRFLIKTIDYLAHVIQPRKPKTVLYTTDAIMQLEEACTVTEIRSFSELCNIFRCFATRLL